MPSIRAPYCPLLRSPFAAVGVLLFMLLGGLFLYMARHDRIQMEIGFRGVKDDGERDLWQTYGVAIVDGSLVTEGMALPVGTRLRTVRLDGTQPEQSQAQFTLMVFGRFEGVPAGAIEVPPGRSASGNAREWGSANLPLGAVVRLDRPGEVRATVIQRDLFSGPQKPLVFTVVDLPPAPSVEAGPPPSAQP